MLTQPGHQTHPAHGEQRIRDLALGHRAGRGDEADRVAQAKA